MGWTAITEAFRSLKGRGERALVAYLMGGDPDPSMSLEYLCAVAEGGADLLEVGIPFSDPVADGPTIQAAGLRALESGATTETVLEVVRGLKREYPVPLVLMGYYNPILRFGEGAFCTAAAECGVDGLIVPDLPPEEAAPLRDAAERVGLGLVFLATPETVGQRLDLILRYTKGFLYLVSRYGTTGERERLSREIPRLVGRVRERGGKVPIAVGFGISRPEHIRTVLEAGADGAVVGSRLVREVGKGASPEALARLVRELKAATLP
jgi:tryptophan synthase alpha chain